MKTILKKFKVQNAPVKYLPGEQWTALKLPTNHPYLISTKGRIYSTARDRIIAGKIACGVYVFEFTPTDIKKLPAYADGSQTRRPTKKGTVSMTFQQLVAMTFLPKPKGTSIVIHINYDKKDNAVDNLQWVRKKYQGIHSVGSPNFRPVVRKNFKGQKLDVKQIEQIKRVLERKRSGVTNITIKQIGDHYGVSTMNIYRIQNGEIWNHTGKLIKPKTPQIKTPPEVVAKVRQLHAEGWKGTEIALEVDLPPSSISRIITGKTYAYVKT